MNQNNGEGLLERQTPLGTYFPFIDGLRTLSIFLIIAFHCYYLNEDSFSYPAVHRFFITLQMGVDCFFVISGFLITSILLKTKGHPNFFRNFYGRRTIRILFPYYLFLITYFFVTKTTVDKIWYFGYFSNFIVALRGFQYPAIDISWSLSIEEQFYILWPLAIYSIPQRKLPFLFIFGVFMSLFFRQYYVLSGASAKAHFFTHCRLDGLMMGSFIALYSGNRRSLYLLWKYLKPLSLISLIVFSLLNYSGGGWRFWQNIFNYSLLAFIFGGLLLKLLLSEEAFGRRVLSRGFLRLIGKRSYGMYLFHFPVIAFLKGIVPQISSQGEFFSFGLQIVHIVCSFIISFLLAQLFYIFIENHTLRLKSFFSYSL